MPIKDPNLAGLPLPAIQAIRDLKTSAQQEIDRLSTVYALLAGRPGGQTVYGGTNSGDNYTLESTSHATKGYVLIQPNGGYVGFGKSNPAGPIDLAASTAIITSNFTTLNVLLTATPAAISSANYYGAFNVVDYTADFATNSGYWIIGAWGEGRNSGSATLENIAGAWCRARNSSTGTINDNYGAVGQSLNTGAGTIVRGYGVVGASRNSGTGTVNDAVGVYGDIINANASGYIINAYNIRAAVPYINAGTIDNLYGVYIDEQSPTGGGTITNKWALYQAGANDRSYFAGNVSIGMFDPSACLSIMASGTIDPRAYTTKFHYAGSYVHGAIAFLARARGTPSIPTSVVEGDALGSFIFSGYNETAADYDNYGAYIKALVDGEPGNNDMPGRLEFGTTADGSNWPTTRMTLTSKGLVGIGASAPATLLELAETKTITVLTADGYAASLTLDPEYTAASAQTVTRHNYIDINTPGLTNITLTDAAVFRFDAAAGTHKAVDAGTTKTTPGTVNAWMKININGTIYHVPAYTSKTT